jgi:hypothetical protein
LHLKALHLEFISNSYNHTKNLDAFALRGTWLLLGLTMYPREQGPKLPMGATMFLREQMCPKFCVIIILSYEFWLKCIQLQSCNSSQGCSNDRSQDYIKETEMVMVAKRFKTYVFLENLGLSLGKFIIPWGSCPFLRGHSPTPRES